MSSITVNTRISETFREWTPKLRLDFGKKAKKLSDDDFFLFCLENPDVRIEMDPNGDIEIMPPTGAETGIKNFELTVTFGTWVKKDGSGVGFDSSTGFRLRNGATRSPDLSWMTLEKWNAIPKAKRKKFATVCPDFVLELCSETDTLAKLQSKMEEYIENGASLGWMIDPDKRTVYVYRSDVDVEILKNPKAVSGEPFLRGFTLNIQEIWK